MESSRSTFKDYYYILGVHPDADTKQIQEAYHDLYEKYGPHISVSGQDPDMLLKTFKDISEAYEVLMDPVKRKKYDEQNTQYINKGDLRALWGQLTGVHAPKDEKIRRPAAQMEVEIELTLREAIKGAKKQIRVEEPKPCDDCAGLKPVQRMQCPNCRGLGYTTTSRLEEVELPAGCYERMEVVKSGIGKYDLQAGRNGDMVIVIRLSPHPLLSVLLGRDLTCTVPITIYEAVLGGEVEVPTATGKVIMRVQPRTQSGRVYRLKGLGLAGADQLVTVEVSTPQNLSEDEVELYRKLKEMSKDPNPRQSLYSTM